MTTSTKLAEDEQEAVWQAQGILMELLGCEPDEAGVWLRWRARIDKRTVVEAAVEFVRRTDPTIA
jgi:AmiR/NasT family two-component response regulator